MAGNCSGRRPASSLPGPPERFGPMRRLQMRQDAVDDRSQDRHHVKVAPDEPHFHIQADILVDVADGVVRLGAENRGDFEHTLEHADHDLLVELRALCQERALPEVVHRKHVRAALRGRGHQLGRLDLGETQAAERLPEPGHHPGGEPESRTRLVGCRRPITAWSRKDRQARP